MGPGAKIGLFSDLARDIEGNSAFAEEMRSAGILCEENAVPDDADRDTSNDLNVFPACPGFYALILSVMTESTYGDRCVHA